MPDRKRVLWLTIGVVVGVIGAAIFLSPGKRAWAGNDRYEDFIICTGAVAVGPRALTDGVWVLDYRTGKLMGTVIDRGVGKILGWAEIDLAKEFEVPPRQNVHFLMTTGNIAHGQAALYVAETTSGKFGVYTMGPRADGAPGMGIRRHDMVVFRQPIKEQG